MRSRGLGAALLIGALALAITLFVVLRDDESSSTTPTATETTTTGDGPGGDGPGDGKPSRPPRPRLAEIVVRGGEPVGGVQELSFTKGERIRFKVRSDVADHVHLHGYDVFMDVPAGGAVSFDVPATIEGVFEVELEDRVVPLAEITVNPG